MAEGMTTRYRALEDSIASLTQGLATVASTVQQHAERFDNVEAITEQFQHSFTEVQQSVTEIRQTLARLERHAILASNAPLLPTPTNLTSSQPSNSHSSNQTLPIVLANPQEPQISPRVRLPKMELPFFSGENAIGWLFQIERFFVYHNTPPDQKLTVAAFYMTGAALQWYHWMHTTNQLFSWELFARNLELRFGPSSYMNHEATLYKLRQNSTVTAYMAEFESLSTRTPD